MAKSFKELERNVWQGSRIAHVKVVGKAIAELKDLLRETSGGLVGTEDFLDWVSARITEVNRKLGS